MSGTHLQNNSLSRRFVAALGVALVLMLNVLALRPDLHEALCHHETAASACSHQHESGESAHPEPSDTDPVAVCIVTLFAHGVSVPFDMPALPSVERILEAVISSPGEVKWVAALRHLRPPTQAPPARLS